MYPQRLHSFSHARTFLLAICTISVPQMARGLTATRTKLVLNPGFQLGAKNCVQQFVCEVCPRFFPCPSYFRLLGLRLAGIVSCGTCPFPVVESTRKNQSGLFWSASEGTMESVCLLPHAQGSECLRSIPGYFGFFPSRPPMRQADKGATCWSPNNGAPFMKSGSHAHFIPCLLRHL